MMSDAVWFHFESKPKKTKTTCQKHMRHYKPLGLVRKEKIGQKQTHIADIAAEKQASAPVGPTRLVVSSDHALLPEDPTASHVDRYGMYVGVSSLVGG